MTHGRVGARPGKQSSCQRTVVEAGPPDDNWPTSPIVNIFDSRHRISDELRCGVLFDRLDDIDEVVRNPGALVERHFVGPDIESAVDSGGIAADDFAAAPQSELDAEPALPCGGRPQDGENRRAQTLHPEKHESHGRAQEDQKA
jgi:hypothetical protein